MGQLSIRSAQSLQVTRCLQGRNSISTSLSKQILQRFFSRSFSNSSDCIPPGACPDCSTETPDIISVCKVCNFPAACNKLSCISVSCKITMSSGSMIFFFQRCSRKAFSGLEFLMILSSSEDVKPKTEHNLLTSGLVGNELQNIMKHT